MALVSALRPGAAPLRRRRRSAASRDDGRRVGGGPAFGRRGAHGERHPAEPDGIGPGPSRESRWTHRDLRDAGRRAARVRRAVRRAVRSRSGTGRRLPRFQRAGRRDRLGRGEARSACTRSQPGRSRAPDAAESVLERLRQELPRSCAIWIGGRASSAISCREGIERVDDLSGLQHRAALLGA